MSVIRLGPRARRRLRSQNVALGRPASVRWTAMYLDRSHFLM
jgi:hypothetical protein